MFPSWGNTWCNTWDNTSYRGESVSRKSQLEAKLRFLKVTRDDLETKLAATNAAIEQTEQQLRRQDTVV